MIWQRRPHTATLANPFSLVFCPLSVVCFPPHNFLLSFKQGISADETIAVGRVKATWTPRKTTKSFHWWALWNRWLLAGVRICVALGCVSVPYSCQAISDDLNSSSKKYTSAGDTMPRLLHISYVSRLFSPVLFFSLVFWILSSAWFF